jgi:hypothetical protein
MVKIASFLLLCFASLLLVFNSHIDITNSTNSSISVKQLKDTLDINDGPYIFIKNDSLIEKTIKNGTIESTILDLNSVKIDFVPEKSVFKNVSRIAALSDIHGQLDLAMSILNNNGIIDDHFNWAFGDGHLVIVGDIFDRGTKVTELLWFIYNLEQQAIEKGGMVHFVLGNHEYMVLQNDLRYLNPKYKRVAQLLNTPFNELFNKQTLLGRWLRSKSTVIKINDNLFVHGGLSKEFIANDFDLEKTNNMMRQSLNEDLWTTKSDSIYGKFYDNYGPIWYRGYFHADFKKADLNKLLRKLDVKHIVVGHTSQTQIESLFDNKILAVDSSIKNGVYGEVLLIENGKFYRGTLKGEKILLK